MLGRQKYKVTVLSPTDTAVCPSDIPCMLAAWTITQPRRQERLVFSQTVLLYPKPLGFPSHQVRRIESKPVSPTLRRPHSSQICMYIFVLINMAQKSGQRKAHHRSLLPCLLLLELQLLTFLLCSIHHAPLLQLPTPGSEPRSSSSSEEVK